MKGGITSVGAVLGLVAAGFGGYNLVTTGCPLGTCDAPASITAASMTSEHVCALGCSEHAPKAVDVVAVSAAGEATKSGCCAGDAQAKADKLAKGESCCGGCTEKAGCEGESKGTCDEGKGETCPVTGQTSADKDQPAKADPKQPA